MIQHTAPRLSDSYSRSRWALRMTGAGQIATRRSTHRGPGPRQNRGCRRCLKFDLLRDGEGVIHLDPEVPNGTLEFRMPEQQLHRSQVAGLLVNLSGLSSAD